MSATKVCAAALMLLSTEAYKFQPLIQNSPGSAGVITVTEGAALTRGTTLNGPYSVTAVTAQDPLNAGNTGGSAVAYTQTTATVQPVVAGNGASTGGALAAGAIMIRNGGSLTLSFTNNIAWVNGFDNTDHAGFNCAAGIDQEMIAADQGVDCSAQAALTATGRPTGLVNFGSIGPFAGTAAPAITASFTPNTDLLSPGSNYNGRWICWLGTAQTTQADAILPANAGCTTTNTEPFWQKVLSVGTATATPTPTPGISPSASPTSPLPSPSASPTSGSKAVSGCMWGAVIAAFFSMLTSQ